jgi:hypothetical protein
MGKNTVKGAPQVSGHFFKLHFCMFERSQRKHNNLDCHKKFGIISIYFEFYMFKSWHKSKMFLHVQNTQTSRVASLYFFKMFFFLTKCASFLLKIGEDFNIDD